MCLLQVDDVDCKKENWQHKFCIKIDDVDTTAGKVLIKAWQI